VIGRRRGERQQRLEFGGRGSGLDQALRRDVLAVDMSAAALFATA
jgi:hypothetical protein